LGGQGWLCPKLNTEMYTSHLVQQNYSVNSLRKALYLYVFMRSGESVSICILLRALHFVPTAIMRFQAHAIYSALTRSRPA
jgi:hypothetical protein